MLPDKILSHLTEHDWIDQEFREYLNHPVCPRCERIALRDKGKATCPHCHHTFEPSATVKEYIENQLYR